jgi:hypothetical protein
MREGNAVTTFALVFYRCNVVLTTYIPPIKGRKMSWTDIRGQLAEGLDFRSGSCREEKAASLDR